MTLESNSDHRITQGPQLLSEGADFRGRGREPVHQDNTQFLSLFRQKQERLPALRSRLLLVDFLMARFGKVLSIPGVSNEFVIKAQLRQPLGIKRWSFFNRLPDRAGDPGNGFYFVGIDDHQVLDTDLVELVFLKELGEKAVLSI